MRDSGAPTIKDVAREAGVAVGTVSKYINGKHVRDEYAARIRAAIDKLDYRVNSYAQGMKSGKTRAIALLIPNLVMPFYAMLANSIISVLQGTGYKVFISCTDRNPDIEQECIDMAMQNKVDGIIGLTYNPNLLVHPGTPFVSIDWPHGQKNPCVSSDNFAGGQLAAQKLAELGCKSVLLVREGSDLNNEPNKRMSGFENGCAISKLSYSSVIASDSDPDHDALFRRYLEGHMENGRLTFDGIFCVTDSLAFRIQKILESLGVHVPDDVQIIGYDGIRNFGDLDYHCSTIVQPVEDMAKMCVTLLLSDLTTKPPLVCLPVTYAPGGTTKDSSNEPR